MRRKERLKPGVNQLDKCPGCHGNRWTETGLVQHLNKEGNADLEIVPHSLQIKNQCSVGEYLNIWTGGGATHVDKIY